MTGPARRTLIWLGALAILPACGSATATNTPTHTAAPASSSTTSDTSSVSGQPLITAAFSTVIPDGWRESTSACGSGPTVQMCIWAGQGAGAEAIIEAWTLPQPASDSDLSSALKRVVDKAGGQDEKTGTETVAGDDAVALTYNTNPSDAAATQNEDVAVNHGGKTYDISLLVRAGTNWDTYSAAFQDVLSAWGWR